jgi:large subunit ribosomal protein L32
MPVPKRKRSRARRDSRFANKGIKVKAIAGCLNCKDPIVPHTACKNCGFYKGVKVLTTKADRTVKRLAVKTAKTPVKKASDESQAE